MDELPLISTNIMSLRAYIVSPRIEILTEHFGEYLEGITKGDKWALISLISQTLHLSQDLLSSGQLLRHSVVDVCEHYSLDITSLYPLNPIAIISQMEQEELKFFV
ncbi:MAG: hypothetical protein F6K36_29195, partial [Symploca sp. SIO3C6]|nr:hypothetical protein [Symploca sp. SIO3C6]